MTTCDHADDGPCMGGHGTLTPEGTTLTLCLRHYNAWLCEQGTKLAQTTRPRYSDGEAIPGLERER